MGKTIQTRAQSGVSHFNNPIRKDWLKRKGIVRENIQLGRRVRRRPRFFTPGEVEPFIEFFDVGGQQQPGLNPGTHYRHAVRIDYTGGRQGDFALANAAANLPQTPAGYVWHHFHDWMPPVVHGGNGSGTLYLMTTAEHAVYHCGGVMQAETYSGVPYRP